MLRKILLGAVASASMVTAANAFIIDTFSEGAMNNTVAGPEDAAAPDRVQALTDNETASGLGDGVSYGSIIGGYRDMITTLVASPSTGRDSTALIDTTTTTFVHSQDTGVRSNTYLIWDGLGGIGLASEDLTDGGINDLFHMIVLSADHGASLSLQVDDSDSSFTYIFSIPDIMSATNYYIPFSVFTDVDMTDVRKIVLGANITSVINLDSEIDFFGTTHFDVPEPASMTLLGAGLMGMGYMGRRRKA